MLTRKQEEVVGHVCRGLSNKEIARALGISPGTVKVHMNNILVRTGHRNRIELIIAWGAVPESTPAHLAASPVRAQGNGATISPPKPNARPRA